MSVFIEARRRRTGFTLIEMMLVVVIIGVILAVVAPRIVGKSDKARRTAAEQTIQNLCVALDGF